VLSYNLVGSWVPYWLAQKGGGTMTGASRGMTAVGPYAILN
jgi:hypothetical protein